MKWIAQSDAPIHAMPELKATSDKYCRAATKLQQSGRCMVGTQPTFRPRSGLANGTAIVTSKQHDTLEPDHCNNIEKDKKIKNTKYTLAEPGQPSPQTGVEQDC